MKTFSFQVVALLVVIFVGLILSRNPRLYTSIIPSLKGEVSPSTQSGEKIKIIGLDSSGNEVEKVVLNVEVADTKEEKSRGLSGRSALSYDSGMLFAYDKPELYRFWMKDMKFPLDFIWINGDTIVDLLPNVPLPVPGQQDQSLPIYQPVTKIDKLLEVNAGVVEAKQIQIGDRLRMVE